MLPHREADNLIEPLLLLLCVCLILYCLILFTHTVDGTQIWSKMANQSNFLCWCNQDWISSQFNTHSRWNKRYSCRLVKTNRTFTLSFKCKQPFSYIFTCQKHVYHANPCVRIHKNIKLYTCIYIIIIVIIINNNSSITLNDNNIDKIIHILLPEHKIYSK